MTTSEIPQRIAIKRPFAESGLINPIQDTACNSVNYPQGFPSAYSSPSSNGGKYVSRGDMNALGNIATTDLFYHKCGGINTFDAEFARKVGGYPKGAVLQYLNGRYLYDVISLVDNNMDDFVSTGSIDGANWAYCNREESSSTMTLFGETLGITVMNGVNENTFFAFPIGVFRASKTGPVIPIVNGSVDTENIIGLISWYAGIGIICKDLGESSVMPDMPLVSSAVSQGWKFIYINQLRSADNYITGLKSENVEYGKNYAFAYFAASMELTTIDQYDRNNLIDHKVTTSLSSIKLYIS